MTDLFDLTGRHAIVTGAGLLGTQHCIALMQKNCSITLVDISEEKLDDAKNIIGGYNFKSDFLTLNLDITDKEQLASKLTVPTVENLILINNAAVNPKVEEKLENFNNFEDLTEEKLLHEFKVSIIGAINCCQVVSTVMKENNSGVILNIASDLSVIAPDQRIYSEHDQIDFEARPKKPVGYSICKTGLIGLTKYLSTYWAEFGIRVNALSPGGVYQGQPSQFVKKLEHLIPLGHMASEDQYRGAVQFLCSDASNYLTGQNIVMDGGRSVW